MRKRNPLSDKRRALLQKRFARYSNIDQLLDWVAEADPTHSGEYASWILQMQLDRQIIMPEDIEKVQNKLRLFAKVKPRMPVELRDINTYQSYGQLATTVDQYASIERLQVSAEEVSGIEILGEHRQEGNRLTIIKVTTPRPATILAEGTEWCVKSPRFAKQYLESGPLYFIDLNDRRFLLAHVSDAKNPIVQIMDVYDKPINNEIKKLVTPLFKDILPQFICKRHPEGELKTEECPQCSRYPFCSSVHCLFICDVKKCEAEGCEDCIQMCSICESSVCDKHQQECSHCNKFYCFDCVELCNDPKGRRFYQRKVCHDCMEGLQCKNCGNIYCDNDELTACEICDKVLCRDCVGYCVNCSLNVCHDHANFCEVGGCNNVVCKKCDVSCFCGNSICEFCQNTCTNCEEVVCANCFTGKVCVRCDDEEEDLEQVPLIPPK